MDIQELLEKAHKLFEQKHLDQLIDIKSKGSWTFYKFFVDAAYAVSLSECDAKTCGIEDKYIDNVTNYANCIKEVKESHKIL